jgi:hypothetical protein
MMGWKCSSNESNKNFAWYVDEEICWKEVTLKTGKMGGKYYDASQGNGI